MKSLNYCVPAVLIFWLFSMSFSSPDSNLPDPDPLVPGLAVFTAADAEKILGEPASLTDSAITVVNQVWTYKSTFTAKTVDPATGKTGAIYFMIERYPEAAACQATYTDIKRMNADHEGVEVLQDLGDEAYYHSDGRNFVFVLVRVGNHLLRMKVNKLTSNTALDQFRQVANDVATMLRKDIQK